jgi:hypothetical protein
MDRRRGIWSEWRDVLCRTWSEVTRRGVLVRRRSSVEGGIVGEEEKCVGTLGQKWRFMRV